MKPDMSHHLVVVPRPHGMQALCQREFELELIEIKEIFLSTAGFILPLERHIVDRRAGFAG
jgi:hypothetical protein